MINLTLGVCVWGKNFLPRKDRPEGSLFVVEAKVWYGAIAGRETYWLHREDEAGKSYTVWYESDELREGFHCCARYDGNPITPEEVARQFMIAMWGGRYGAASMLNSFEEGGLLSNEFLAKLAEDYHEGLKPPKVRRGTKAIQGELYYGESGVLRYRGEIRDGLPHGKGIGYWETGNAWCEGAFRNGQPHGRCRLYFKDGQLRYEGTMRDGHPSGRGRELYDNGNVWFEGIFGKKPSIYYGYGCRHWVRGKKYDRDGKLQHKGSFRFDGKHSQPISKTTPG